jgi:serine/threonine protein kinase
MRATLKYSRGTTMVTTEVLNKDSFKIVKKLGKGAYGSVFLVKKKSKLSTESEKLFAMKELEKDHILKYDKI